MNGPEVCDEVLDGEQELVRHLYLYPWPVKPPHQIYLLFVSICESDQYVSIFPGFRLNRPVFSVFFVSLQLNYQLDEGFIGQNVSFISH